MRGGPADAIDGVDNVILADHDGHEKVCGGGGGSSGDGLDACAGCLSKENEESNHIGNEDNGEKTTIDVEGDVA